MVAGCWSDDWCRVWERGQVVAGCILDGFDVHADFAVHAAFFVLRGARQVERFDACIFEQLAPRMSFLCSSQLQIQEAAKVKSQHRLS